MDKHVQKLKNLVNTFLHNSKEDILKEWGNPGKGSDNELWSYKQYRWGIFTDEIIFVIQENHVVDIMMIQYIFWKEYKSIFYYEGEYPEYQVVRYSNPNV